MLAKIEVKMKAMDRKIDKEMDDMDRKIDELKQQPKLKNTTEEPQSDNSHHIPFRVIDTPSYKKLLNEFNDLKEGETYNTLGILGPEGCGKTTSLLLAKKKLSEKYVVKYTYIDLGRGDLTNDTIKCDVLYYLIMHSYTRGMSGLQKSAMLLQQFHLGPWPVKILEYSRRHVVMGEVIIIHFTPIDLPLSQSYRLRSRGILVTPDSESGPSASTSATTSTATPLPVSILIDESEFQDVHFNTGGIPRYLDEYYEHKKLNVRCDNLPEMSGKVRKQYTALNKY